MTQVTGGIQTTGAIVVELEIAIDAPREKVWDAFINKIGDWWHKDFYVAKRPARFVLEPKLGGKGYEDCGDGTGFVWFEILAIEPNESLYVQGQVRPPFGGPATSLIMFTLEENGADKTVLKISDAIHGHVTDKMAESLDSGWKMLFANLKEYAEK